MRNALVVNDIHIGSKYNDDPEAKSKLDKLIPDGVTVLNGDIVDLSACKKKDVKQLRAYQDRLKEKWGYFYIRGNHDLMPTWYKELIIGKTLFTHGHLVGDSKRVAKWTKYENKKAGANFWKLIWVDVADDMDWIKGMRPLPDDIIRSAAKLAKSYGCVEVILGHYHPLKELRYEHDGVVVRCLPKGFNHIQIVG